MPVSSGLQKYFDAQRKKKQGDCKKKLDTISDQIHPSFMRSFEEFHDKILGIVDDDPLSQQVASEELDAMSHKLSESRQRYELEKSACIIKHTE